MYTEQLNKELYTELYIGIKIQIQTLNQKNYALPRVVIEILK